MRRPEDLLRSWQHRVPSEGATRSDVTAVLQHLGFTVRPGGKGHLVASHSALVGSPHFPQGVLSLNCHAFGKADVVHPLAVRDVVRAARTIRGE